MEIKIKIEDTEGLEGAIHTLAQVLAGMDIPQTRPKVEVENWPPEDTTAEEKEEPEPQPEPAPEPEKEEPKQDSGLKFEDVRVKLAQVSQAGKQKELKELLTNMGVQKLSDVPQERYKELLEKASEL